MVAPKQPGSVRRCKTSGAELGRARVLEVLADYEPHGVQWIAKQAKMSTRTLMQRLKELDEVVEVKRQAIGCAMACLRTTPKDQAASLISSE